LEYYRAIYKPRLQQTPSSVVIGRVELSRDEKLSARLLKAQTAGTGTAFSLTKHSLRLMERLALCVRLNEPTLLVGETGNGKTAVIQALAQHLGKQLMVQNLNQQSDSSDFLGGFKPVDLRTVCVPLMNSFGKLFPKTFSKSANAEFLSRYVACGLCAVLCSSGSHYSLPHHPPITCCCVLCTECVRRLRTGSGRCSRECSSKR
jgi:midasin